MVDWVKSKNEQVIDAFDHGEKNCTMTSSDIQKELAMCCAHEVTKVIMEELGDRQLYVLIDESRDIFVKEQMTVMLSCSSIHDFFEYISLIVTTTSASCKRMGGTTQRYFEIARGRGLHQSSSLARPGDTRWGSHHTTLLRLDQMWSSVLEVLSMVDEDGRGPSQAASLIEKNGET
ncbi:zinc finger MYM-type protein 1-like [Trifolium medium]|uniref:Zinc finger MYM-type protein 1-like n=1 Tax=Trifolium medium TaxID=97028 RepID=A0A392NQ27_9FABA|nr:zinc finger MYM-type protein 1-like [Trifolium medium]